MASSQPRVTILLSTYNGARYLQEQLDSLLDQTHKNWVLYWRDDGSTDGTVEVLRAFAEQVGQQLFVESPSSGPHLGAAASFLTLLREQKDNGPVAFADQDDVWLPEKLARAMAWLRQTDAEPALYCARQYLVDEHLRGARLSALHGEAPAFPACLTQNIANGNTLVLNGQAAALVASANMPDGSVHDWWSYIVVSAAGGRILFDPQPQVLYRLHKENLIGRAHPLPWRALAALRRGPAIYMTMMGRHTDHLMAQPGRLSPQARQDLRLIQSGLRGGLLNRLNALRCRRFRRRTWLENLLFSYWFITNAPALPSATAALPGKQAALPS